MSKLENNKYMLNRYDEKRNLKIDMIKGIAIFLVLWGHYIQYTYADTNYFYENNIFKFIYSFHMPLFMLISGYLFYGTLQRKSLKQIMLSRLTGFIVPIVIWFIFTTVKLWFLWSVLAASIWLSLTVKLLPKKIQPLSGILGFFVMYLFPNPEENLYMYPYFILGYYYKSNEIIFKKYNKYAFIAIPVFAFMLIFFKKEHFIYTTGITIWNSKYSIDKQISINIYRYIIGLIGSISVIIIASKAFNKIPKYVKEFLTIGGRYSMQIYILQLVIFKVYSIIVIIIVNHIGNNIFTKNAIIYNFILTPLLAIVTLITTVKIAKIIGENSKISKVLFGR